MAGVQEIIGDGDLTIITGGYNPTGAYNALTAYVKGDGVSYAGSSYVAKQATTGNLPTNATYWQVIANGYDNASFNAATDARIATTSIDALSDVTITSPATGQLMKWNGSAWVNFRPLTRHIKPNHWSIASTSATFVVGTVYMEMIEIPFDCLADAIEISNNAVVSGNVRVGLYGVVDFTATTPSGVNLIVESASVAQAGANSPQFIPFTETFLAAGKYYLAFQMDNTTGTLNRHPNVRQGTGWGRTYVLGGSVYGAFTSTCPATIDTASNLPAMLLRVSG